VDELRSWLRDVLLAGKELAALDGVDEAEAVPGSEMAALPAQLMRAVR
jgi:hypothetical protein